MSDEITPPSIPSPLASEVYDQAAEHIRNGWTQRTIGAWNRPTGAVCALGAIMRVLTQDMDIERPTVTTATAYGRLQYAVEDRARTYTLDLLPLATEGWEAPQCSEPGCCDTWASVEAFNDYPDRTQEDVIALLEKGRAWAAEQGW